MNYELKISVIIPIYNMERYLEQTLSSLTAQDMDDAEFICVDDLSTDGSADIIRRFMASDKRFKGIFLEKNGSVMQARKKGALASKGKYIMFLDGDDYYEKDACRYLYGEMERQSVDILQFGTNIISDGERNKSSFDYLIKSLRPCAETVEAEGWVLNAKVFLEGKWSFTLWNKIYAREACIKAFSAMEDGYFPKGEDLYTFFLIQHFAKSYRGIPNKNLYNYCYGRGMHGHSHISLSKFSSYCAQKKASDALSRFIGEKKDCPAYEKIAGVIAVRFLRETLGCWLNSLETDSKGAGFDMMCETWGAVNVITELAKQHYFKRIAVAEALRGSELTRIKNRSVKTIGIYYHTLYNGGVERVISLLSFLWKSMGYDIVVITDETPNQKDYPVPEGVKRVKIPDFRRCNSSNIEMRMKAFMDAISENHIDVVDYNAWASSLLIWDLLAIKTAGALFNYHTHSICTYGFNKCNDSVVERYAIAPLTDSITSLSRVDVCLWKGANKNVYYINNPIDPDEIRAQHMSRLDGKTVLWVGRISAEKNPLDAVKAFEIIKRTIGEAKLVILGDGNDEIKAQLRKAIYESKLYGDITLADFDADVKKYYLNASVVISTSAYEGYSMVIQEACTYGVPVVMYSMDYLELARQCPGVISVEAGDYGEMAAKAIEILSDDKYRADLGKRVRTEIEAFAGDGIADKWREVFESYGKPANPVSDAETVDLFVKTLMGQYDSGVKLIKQFLAGAPAYAAADPTRRVGTADMLTVNLDDPDMWTEFAGLYSGSDKLAYWAFDGGDENTYKMSLSLASRNSTGAPGANYESFELPAVAGDLSFSKRYSILTSKDGVGLSEGGTGATNARDANSNLQSYGLAKGVDIKMGEDLNEILRAGVYASPQKHTYRETMPGFPTGRAFKLIVEEINGKSSVKQTVIDCITGYEYSRMYTREKWGAWDAASDRERIAELERQLAALHRGGPLTRLARKIYHALRKGK